MNEQAPKQIFFVPLLSGLFVALLVFLSAFGHERNNARLAAVAIAAVPLAEPELSAEAYVVRLAGEERSLIARRADKPVPPASLTKIMTAVVAAEKLVADDTAVLSPYAKAVEERKSPAKAGETFSRDDLLRMALAMSANDAALALAERVGQNVGGARNAESVSAFVGLMNARARILGLVNTHFENPTGLDMPRHLSSASDLSRLAEYVLLRHPQLWAMTRETESHAVSSAGAKYGLTNSNELLKEFHALLGGKTGLTDNAKEALVLLYPVAPNRIAIAVILRSDDRFGDGRKIIQWLEANCLASRGDLGERPCEP